MRIAQVCQSYPPMVSGAAVFIEQLSQALAEGGHEVLVIAASDRGPAYSEVRKGVAVVRLQSYGNPLRVGQRFLGWPSRSVTSALDQFQPNVLHLHDPVLAGLGGIRAARRLGIPAVLSVHQTPSFVSTYLPLIAGLRTWVEAQLWTIFRPMLSACQAVVVPSNLVAEVIRQHGPFEPDVIGCGVEPELFTPQPRIQEEPIRLRRKYGLPPSNPILLHVGRLDTDKRVDLVLRAAASAMQAGDAHLVIVGDGTQRAAAERLGRDLEIEGLVHFLGYVGHSDDLPGLYRLAEVFVTASEIETLGIAVLEAMASGLPIVAVRAGAVPELVMDGRNGLLSPPGDAGGLAASLRLLLNDRLLARAMGRAGRAEAELRSLAWAVEAHESLYRRLADAASG